MDTVLVSVTLVSLGLAGSMGVLVARMLRDERRRSDARVEALIQLASEQPADRTTGTERVEARNAAPPARRTAPAPATPLLTRESPLGDLEIRSPAAGVAADLFAQPVRSSPWGRRFVVIGVLAAAGGVLLAGLGWSGNPGNDSGEARVAERRIAPPLELVALRYTQDRDMLTITGLVLNPKGGARLTRIAVTAVAFGPDGTLVASGKAPLDFTSLAPGDESPFVVAVPVRGAVARYRVGFRSEDGGVVAHIDRRAADVSRAGL